MKSRLLHLPLEPYRQRYTEWLHSIEQVAFTGRFEYKALVPPSEEGTAVLDIAAGSVLDSFNRPIYAMEQMKLLLGSGGRDAGKVYFSDFFHPGLEALPYSGMRFQAFSFCWAQSFDQYDFTAPMSSWMRPWEIMALDIYSKVFVASPMLAELIGSAVPGVSDKIETVGLPFDSKHVAGLLQPEDVPSEGFDVVYSSRWDAEKRPEDFLALVEARPDLKFVVCTGSAELKGTDSAAIDRAKRFASKPGTNLFIRSGLTKSQYYGILSVSKVQFNCALQDWISFTLLEALTFGCRPLYPAHRSFPEALSYDERCLYRPFDTGSALDKLDNHLTDPGSISDLSRSVLEHHDGTLERIANVIRNY